MTESKIVYKSYSLLMFIKTKLIFNYEYFYQYNNYIIWAVNFQTFPHKKKEIYL